jgi:hypothetical protein
VALGDAEGLSVVGDLVGFDVGAAVGTCVGDSVGATQPEQVTLQYSKKMAQYPPSRTSSQAETAKTSLKSGSAKLVAQSNVGYVVGVGVCDTTVIGRARHASATKTPTHGRGTQPRHACVISL